jgi:hypothetical protein
MSEIRAFEISSSPRLRNDPRRSQQKTYYRLGPSVNEYPVFRSSRLANSLANYTPQDVVQTPVHAYHGWIDNGGCDIIAENH